MHGGHGSQGQTHTILLKSGESIIGIDLSSYDWWDRVILRTNLRVYGPYGGQGGVPRTPAEGASLGSTMTYFEGYAGENVYNSKVYYLGIC